MNNKDVDVDQMNAQELAAELFYLLNLYIELRLHKSWFDRWILHCAYINLAFGILDIRWMLGHWGWLHQ